MNPAFRPWAHASAAKAAPSDRPWRHASKACPFTKSRPALQSGGWDGWPGRGPFARPKTTPPEQNRLGWSTLKSVRSRRWSAGPPSNVVPAGLAGFMAADLPAVRSLIASMDTAGAIEILRSPLPRFRSVRASLRMTAQPTLVTKPGDLAH